MPCDGACDGDTPRCDEENETCVECLENEHCDEGICDPETHQCVECLENEHCDEPTAHCDPEQQFCVECLENTDCTSPQESVCDAGSCSPCQTNDDCAHLTGTTICNVDAGQCVQCTTAEEAVCDGTSCNPATNTCTTTELGTVDDCQPCLADSDCIGYDQAEPLRRCVPMEFNGELRGQAYCLKRQAAGCERPYSVLITATSVSGAPEETYCGIGQQNVTCEAVLDLFQSRSCPGGQDDECGCPRDEDGNCTAAGVGGLCRTVGAFDNQCTYGCGAINHCPTNFTCANQDPDFCQ